MTQMNNKVNPKYSSSDNTERHAIVVLHQKLKGTLLPSQVNKFHVVCNLEEHLWRIFGKTTDSL